MEYIKQWVKDNLKNYDIQHSNVCLYATSDYIKYLIVKPHSGTDYRWMLRVSTVSAFDRWANSCAIEEFFDKEDELINYLRMNQIQIYKHLLEYLSEEYDELHNAFY